MTELIRKPSEKVAPENERRWMRSYERWLEEHASKPPMRDELMAAAAYADATWENVAGLPEISGSAAVRISSVMLCETEKVPEQAARAVAGFEAKNRREASPDEIRTILTAVGIDPLLQRAQRTLPGSGLLAETPPAPLVALLGDEPPKKRRGRPRKDGLAASAPPKPGKGVPVVTGEKKLDADIELKRRAKKAFEPIVAAGQEIASVLRDVEPRYRPNVLEYARALAETEDRRDDLSAYVESNIELV
jgi:hypothetical protein